MAPEGGKGRRKRVTDLLDDKVKARLRGDDYRLADYTSSSGSEHEGGGLEGGELEGFVDGFFFSDNKDDAWGKAAREVEDDAAGSAGSDGEGDPPPPSAPVVAMIRDLLSRSEGFDPFQRDLGAEVTKVVDGLAGLRDRSAFRRAVMSSLREAGYNAGVCKARWESRGGLTAGSYEYIDVVRDQSPATPPPLQTQQQQRYVVDVEFAGEFVVARPTAEYARVSAELPRVYVGKPEELRRLLRLLAEAAKRSLRAREMHLPPWRKGRYMQAKWLGPYRRTLNPVPSGPAAVAAASPPPSFAPVCDMKCRFVGFDTAAARLVIPPAARTR